jgi:hypothetical protein
MPYFKSIEVTTSLNKIDDLLGFCRKVKEEVKLVRCEELKINIKEFHPEMKTLSIEEHG